MGDGTISIPGFGDFGAYYRRVVAQAPPGSLLVEVGVYRGASLCTLAHAAATADKGLRVLGVDWCRGDGGVGVQDPGSLARSVVGNLDALGLLPTASLLVAESAVAASLLRDGAAYFVFIDAAHDEQSVTRDVALWAPKVTSGGILAGHDWPYDSVRAAVRGVFGDRAAETPETPECWEVRV